MTAIEDPIRTANPQAGYQSLKTDIDRAIARVLDGPEYSLGSVVSQFENSFAEYIGCRYGIGVNSGTDAIHLCLRGLGIGRGDEVITVSQTFVATVAAIEMSGASPVLVDVDRHSYTIDPLAVEEAIGPRTRAVIAVHLYGQPADLKKLVQICSQHGIALIEDCAQSHGSRFGSQYTGSIGAAGCFSFYPTKNLGTVGDGGMILTNDESLAKKAGMLRQYGWDRPQHAAIPGWNSRLGPLQAAILEAKLNHLGNSIEKRRLIAGFYRQSLAGLPLEPPVEISGTFHSYYLFVIRLEDTETRDGLLKYLEQRHIFAGIHFSMAVHEHAAYKGRLRQYPLPVTNSLTPRILSIPVYPELTDAQQNRIVGTVKKFFGTTI